MRTGRREVVVTGLGVVSSLGNDLAGFWDSCLRGRSVVSRIPEHWRHYFDPKSAHWSPLTVPDYSSVGVRRSDLLSYDRAALNVIYAAEQALKHSACEKSCVDERSGRYEIPSLDAYRCGIYVGTGLGCITSTFENYVPHLFGRIVGGFKANGIQGEQSKLAVELASNVAAHPRVLGVASTKCMANSTSALLSIRYGFHGPNETIISACASGSSAIARAYEQIAHGRIDFALAGGTEYYGDRAGGVFMAFDRLNTLAKARSDDDEVNRPFDTARTGFLFSQGGACILTLESYEFARARGAQALARLKGSYSTSDAYSLAALSPDGFAIRSMIKGALCDANVVAAEIDYVNAHGTGTVLNDELEAAVLESEFPHRPFVNSTKALLGHTIGACGAFEAAVAVLGVHTGELHPSVNLHNPIRDLNFVVERTSANIRNAFTHNFGFGGHNVGLVFGQL